VQKTTKPRTSSPRTTTALVEPERSPISVTAPDPIAAKRRLEEGGDLTFMRRAPVQIDSESPYR
jgi:hypothetical protein